MKKYFLLAIGILTAFSATYGKKKTPHFQLGRQLDSIPHPYLLLNSGAVIQTESIQELKKKFATSDNKEYDKKDIKEFSDGKHLYRRLNEQDFARKEYQGKINIWVLKTQSTTTYSNGQTSTGYYFAQYIQNGNDGDLMPLSTVNVSKIIPKTDPAFRYLTNIDRDKKIGKKRQLIGLGLFVGGIALAASGTNAAIITVGGLCIPTGIGFAISGTSKRLKTWDYRDYAVAAYNGTLEPITE